MRTFYNVLANNLVANVTNFTVWFAITFWVFLETNSVFATGMIAGIYLVLTAGFGIWLGSIVDHHSKKGRCWARAWPRRHSMRPASPWC